MATGHVNSHWELTRPTSVGSLGSGTSGSTPSSATSSGSHRNRQLLKSYHDFAMHVFSSNKATQEAEQLFLSAVREGDYERVENFLKRWNHEVVNIDMKDFSTGDTPLIAACRNGHNKVAQLLVRFGADITLRNYDCETAVDISSAAIGKLLLESVERSGCSHRHLLQAAWQGNAAVVRQLLKEGKFLDVNCENADGFTPLLLVTRDIKAFKKFQSVLKTYRPEEVVRVLLGHRADPSATDSEGKTPLHYAAASPSPVAHRITLLLMEDRENLVAQDENSSGPIHVASKHGQIKVLVALLDNGVDINSRGQAGATPLHVSASAGQLQVAHTLLDRGADVTLVDDRGNTPMDVANNRKMRATLKEAWTDATQARRVSTPILSPVKPPPSRKDCHRHYSSSEDTSPRDTDLPPSVTTNRILQKLKDAHQALIAEGQLYRDIDNGTFTPGSLTSSKMNLQSHAARRSISPSKAPVPAKTRRAGGVKMTDSITTSEGVMKRRSSSLEEMPVSSKVKGQGFKGHPKLGYRHSDPTMSRQTEKASLPVTIVGLDWDESIQDIRFARLNQLHMLPNHGGSPSFSGRPEVSKRLTLDLSPSVQKVTDVSTGYLKTRGGRAPPLSETDNQPSLPTVSPSRPLSGTQRTHFFDGNLHLRGCFGSEPSSQNENMQPEIVCDIDYEDDNTDKREESLQDTPLSPLRSIFACTSFQKSNSSQISSNLQRSNALAAANTFNIELSRVNQLKDSSDSGQGSSRSTNSRASTISTPSPLLGEIDGLPSRHQGGNKGSLHLQSFDGESGISLPTLPRDNIRRLDRVQALEECNFRVLANHHRRISEDTMSIVSVSSSVTVKTTDICGQRISLSRTLKEESEVSSSPEQTLNDPLKVVEFKESRKNMENLITGDNDEISSDSKRRKDLIRSNRADAREDASKTDIGSFNTASKTDIGSFNTDGTSPDVGTNVAPADEVSLKQKEDCIKTKLLTEVKQFQTGSKVKSFGKNNNVRENKPSPGKGDRENLSRKTVPPPKEVANGTKLGIDSNKRLLKPPSDLTSTGLVKLKSHSKNKAAKVQRVGQIVDEKRGRISSALEQEISKLMNQKGNGEKGGRMLTRVLPNSKGKQNMLEQSKDSTIISLIKDVVASNYDPVEKCVKNERDPGQTHDDKSMKKSRNYGVKASKEIEAPEGKLSEVQKAMVDTKGGDGKVTLHDIWTVGNKNIQSAMALESESKKKVEGKDSGETNSAINQVSKRNVMMDGVSKSISGRETKTMTQVEREGRNTTCQSSQSLEEVNSSVRHKLDGQDKDVLRNGKVNNVPSVRKSVTVMPSSSGRLGLVDEETATSSILENILSDGRSSTRNSDTGKRTASGRSRGTVSTPTDVTSDLTSDLYSRDSDSLDSVEDIFNEVTFSSGSHNSLEKKTSTFWKEDINGDGSERDSAECKTATIQDNRSKSGAMVLDPAVVVTKTEKQFVKDKLDKVSPKSPKPPKSTGGTGPRKFIFKSEDSETSNKKVGKDKPGKKLEVTKGNNSKSSSPIIKKKWDKPQRSEGIANVDVTSTGGKDRCRETVTSGVQEKKKMGKIGRDQVHHTPIIIDMREDLPECQLELPHDHGRVIPDGTSNISRRHKPTEDRDRKKSAPQQLGQKLSKGSAKTGKSVEKVSNKVKPGTNKSGNRKFQGNSSKETKTRKETLKSPKKGKGKNVRKKEDLRIVSDSESSKTAFITGQGWEIKTSRNESDGVILQRGGEERDLVKLSPANTLKIDYMTKNLPMSPEVMNNIANIMNPVELDMPKLIPDTMDTIKEFVEEEEKTRIIFTFSPMGSPNASCKGSPMIFGGNKMPENTSPSPDINTPGSAVFSPMVGDAVQFNKAHLKTSPDLLKVYKTPNFCDSKESVPSSRSPHPPNGKGLSSTNLNSPIVVLDIPEWAKEALKLKRRSINVMQKPPLPKFGLTKSQRKLLKRRRSTPTELRSSDEDSSDTDSVALYTRRRFLADILDSAEEVDGSGDECSRSKGKQAVDNRKDQRKIGDVILKQEDKENVQVPASRRKHEAEIGAGLEKTFQEVESNSSSKEQLINKHVQTMSMKTLQELNTILSNSEEVDITSPLIPPPHLSSRSISRESIISDKTQTTHSFNQSLPMSESSVGFEVGALDNFRTDSHLSGEMVSTGRGTCLSGSATSGDRSHSQSTNLSESEGGELLHWKKGNILGKGAFGTVYCGLTSTGQLIAVKQVELTGKHHDGEQYEKLQGEVELLKSLQHKNIVGYLGVSLEESVVNIFMQYIPGGSIASLLARFGALEEPVFCRYTKQVVDGTVYLHSNNVIHRDIKGANIMLMSNGVIKLIDFGCAKRLCLQISQSQNLLKSMKGTPYWMAPEVIMETGHGAKSDIWSVGCTVMEMATRKPPWAEMPPMSAIFAIGAGGTVPQLNGQFSSEARAFVDLCLTRNPDERATSLELLQHPFLKNRKERCKDSRLIGRSFLSNFEEGIMFKEQPILKEINEKPRKRRIFEEFE